MANPTVAEDMNEGNSDQMHRIRRSEVLLAELYGPKPKSPQYRVRKVRGVPTMLVVSLMTIAAVVSIIYYKINYFILLREDAYSKSANLDAAVQRRTNLFGNLVRLTLNHAALEHAVFAHTSEMRSEIIKTSKLPDAIAEAITRESARSSSRPPPTPAPAVGAGAGAGAGAAVGAGVGAGASASEAGPGPGGWENILKSLAGEGGMEGTMGRLLAMAEQYPNIKSSETYQHVMSSLVEMEDRIAERRVEYNGALRDYNTAVSSFPWRYLAEVCDFERIGYDHAGDGKTAAQDITPALFQQLVPLVRTMEGPR